MAEILAATFASFGAAAAPSVAIAGGTALSLGVAPAVATLTATSVAAGAAAAGTAGLLAAGGAAVAGIGGALATTFDIIQGGVSAFSAISNIAAGQAEAQSFTQAAAQTAAASEASSAEFLQFEEFGAKQEVLKGREQALRILQEENELLESNMVASLASGITGQGSAKAAQLAVIKKAEFETGITRTQADVNAQLRRSKAQQRIREQARDTALSVATLGDKATTAARRGVTAAAGDVAGFFLNRTRRG